MKRLDWPIRWQLTILYAVLLLITLAVLGLLLYGLLQTYLIADLQTRYQRQATDALAAAGFPGKTTTVLSQDAAADAMMQKLVNTTARSLASQFDSKDTHVTIYGPSGDLLFDEDISSALAAWPALPAKISPTDLPDSGAYTMDSGRWPRILRLVRPLRYRDQTLAVAVFNYSLQNVDVLLNGLRLYLAIGCLLALLVGILVGVPLTRRLLRPLDSITSAASAIAAGDLGRRVGLPGRRNEIARVGQAFDRMVDRLDATLRAQRQFVADASHELRTPLTSLRGYVDILLLGADGDDPETRVGVVLRRLAGEIERLERLVADLLTLSGLDTAPRLDYREIDLARLAGDVLLDACATYPGRNVQPPAGSVTVWGDADRLRQVTWNLVDNVLKYTPQGGNVSVGVRAVDGWAEMNVADDGEGIPAEALPHLFDRFYRVDASRARKVGGLGLGLAIARGIVEAHGGQISAASPGPGAGSTFTVRLPRHAPATYKGDH